MKNIKFKKYILFLFLPAFLLGAGFLISGCSSIKKALCQNEDGKLEFVFSKNEQKEMTKWKGKSFDQMFDDAMLGDPAALQMVGECSLYGLCGNTIDVKLANKFFAVAASLGFPPGLEHVRGMYLEKNEIYLSLLYTNLTASYSHTEYTMGYHELREQLAENGGALIAEEIERIATTKKDAIFKNIEVLKKLQNPKDRQRFVLELLATGGIVAEDVQFDSNYWYRFFESHQKKA